MKNILKASQIELLEDLPLNGADKWYALLAVTGHKKGSWLNIESDIWREGDEKNRIPKERLDLFEQKLKKLGLSYALKFRDTTAGLFQPDEESGKRVRYVQLCDIFVGTTQADCDELVEAHAADDHAKIGLALGYPETAVNVFGKPECMFASDIPEKEFDTSVTELVWFALSKEHYHDEVKLVEEWVNVLKQNSDLIYQELDR